MISGWPVRTGVVVDGDIAYYWGDYGLSLQGYLLASPTRLYVPTGRTTPAVFERSDGSYLDLLSPNYRAGTGGTYAVLDGGMIASGPGDRDEVAAYDADTNDRIATFNGLYLLVNGRIAYLHTKTELQALDRVRHLQEGKPLQECFLWKQPCE